MINNLFKKITDQDLYKINPIDNFTPQDDIQIEIESPKAQIKQGPLDVLNISPNHLVRDYESIKILSMNPQNKRKIMDLTSQSKEDLQKISRLLNGL
jgi:hypothetical protein